MKATKKQTAVEWLVENYLPLKRGVEVEHEKTLKIVNKAKEMEKEQIINDYCNGRISIIEKNLILAEQYYTETYETN